MRRRRARPLHLLCALGLAGCAEPGATLSVALWQPELFSDGEAHDYQAEAEQVAITLVVDGAVSVDRVVQAPVELAIPSVELEAEQSTVEVSFTFVHPSALDATAYTGPVEMRRGEHASATATLAPPLAAHTLDPSLPPVLDGAATCTSDGGAVHIVGGADVAPTPQSYVLDPVRRGFVTGPALPVGRADGACAVDGTVVWAVFGCVDDGDAPALYRSVDGAPFVAVSPAPSGAGCDPDVLVAGGGLWVALGDRLERRSLDGALEFAEDLPTARYGARLVAAAEGVWLAGGTDTRDGAAVVGALHVAAEDALTTVGDEVLLVSDAGALAWADGVVALEPDGTLATIADVDALALPAEFEVGSIAPFGGDGIALLSLDGLGLHLVDGDATRTVELPQARPGASLHPDAAGALRIIGGAVAGTLVVVPSPPLPDG